MVRNRTLVLLIFLVIAAACSSDPIAQRDEYFVSGQQYLENGQYEEAIIQFLNALKADGTYAPARMALIDAYERSGNLRSAIVELRRIVESDAANVEAKLKLGRYYLAAGTQDSQYFDEARKLAEEVLQTEAGNVQAQILLGNAYAGLQDFDRSIETLQKALTAEPGNVDAYLNIGAARFAQRNPEAAEAAFLEAVKLNPESVKAQLGLGNFYLFSARIADAEQAFRKAFDLEPGSPAPLLALVRLYMAQGSPDKVGQIFEEAAAAAQDPTSVRLMQASFLVSQQQFGRAADLLQGLLEKDPANRGVSIQLAEVRLLQNQPETAEPLIDAILGRNERDAGAHLLKARVLLTRKEFDTALSEVNRSVELDPTLVTGRILQADLLQQKGQLAEAEKAARAALELNRGNPEARARVAKLMALQKRSRADLETALNDASDVLGQFPNNIDALSARAEALLALGRLAEARRDFEALDKARPENPFYVHRLGILAALEGKPDEAIAFFKRALAGSPDVTDAVNDLVAIFVQEKRYDDAIRELDGLAARSEKKHLFQVFKGRVYMARGDYPQAERELRRAVEMNADDYQAYLLLGDLMMVQKKLPEAIKEVDELIAKNNQFAPAYLLKAYYLDASGESPGAIEFYRKSLELFPEDNAGYGAAANNLAWLLASRGQSLTEALTYAQRARQIDPQNAHYADTLGFVHYKMGNYTLAVDQYEFAVNQGQPQAQHYYRLGMAYFRKGDTLHARQSLRKALEMSADFDGAAEAKSTLAEIG